MEKENNIFFNTGLYPKNNLRLDKYLSEQTSFSRAEIQRLIKNGNVTSNNIVQTDCSYIIKPNENYKITVPEAENAQAKPQNVPLDIIYEDSDLLVINKPAGMVVHEGAGVHDGTLVNALLYHCGDSLSGIGGVKRPGIVHRIDKETSGLLVVAKNDFTHTNLSAQFEKHNIERSYFAFVYGVPAPLSGTIEGNIGRSKFDRKKMAILISGGKTAVTHYETKEIFGGFASLVRCCLETGRTHQIRVHLSSKGHHLIGDKVYSAHAKSSLKIPADIKDEILHFPRQALHAATLGFIHPRTNEKLFFETPLPPDLMQLLQKLRQNI
ncbi:MAG: RluA family pseudouridine synthase [Alphaproteobacteria bacterium]|nr:RluA family pseudouridine synthase [Alphaproteobacteria bacterium]